MEAIFRVKDAGRAGEFFQGNNGEPVPKRSVVLATRIIKQTDLGPTAVEQELVADLVGERAQRFDAQVGDMIVATIRFSVRQHEGRYFQDIRMVRYATFV